MLFTDFLRVTVMLSAGAATLLGALTVVAADSADQPTLVLGAIGWWVVAAAVGFVLGHRAQTTPPIAALLSSARTTRALPEQSPVRVILNRLWLLLVVTIIAGAIAFLLPQVPAIATGGPLVLSLYWRHQDAAVMAIEDRDGASFYVDRGSPFKPMRLIRAPGFRRQVPSG